MSDPFELSDDPPFEPLAPGPAAPASPAASPVPIAPPVWVEKLNPEQRQAVETTEGPVLVLSGAGTGKTRVLTTRVGWILLQRRARPWQVLAVTFTNRAAREMRERVMQLIGPSAEAVWLGTFHALSVRILRRNAELVGLKSNFTILDSDDQIRLLKQIMEAESIDSKKWPAQGLMGVIQRWKDRGLTPDKVGGEGGSDYANGRAVAMYKAYQERLKTLNAADFGDLLLHCLTLFQTRPDILAEYQEQFHYVLVDEYQDTNVAQYLWLRLLTQKHRNLCCVGDDDQSIYSWRGAEVGNILRFEKDFPDAKVIRLERNYRSTPTILAAASHLIAHNEGRLGKTLRTGLDDIEQGAPIKVRGVWDGAEEARWLVDEIEILQRAGHPLDQIAILVRAGFQMLEFEERLITTGVPYRVVGGPRFYERLEIRDAVAYLRLIQQPDDDLAFERIINKPKRGLGDTTVQKIHILARAQGVSLMEASLRMGETDELRPQARTALAGFARDMERWRSLRETVPPAEIAAQVLEESGYIEMWQKDKSPEAPGRLDNLKEFVSGLDEWENLGGFLDHVSLVMENDANAGEAGVTLMTLHSAKGLEFDTVFMPGWEEDIFPNRRALDESGEKALEEERRLAYVGITRARRRAFISFAANRRVYNQWQSSIPSRFVDELPKENIEQDADQGLYGHRAGGGGWSGFGESARSGAGIRRRLGDYGEFGKTGSWEAQERISANEFRIGDRVFHQKFGYGIVESIDDSKLDIAFDKAGRKKVLDSFVEPSK
ncbi:MAG: UvrD-helicase domain-containing protein [Proteobacteria bacterium]|nr:UvrD-helicase domain-containing protein [Pseudomonadota bacterium]